MKKFLCLALLISFAQALVAQTVDLVQERFEFEDHLTYKADIQSPASFLNYELGEQFTVYEKVVQYVKYLCEQSDRLVLKQYGTTYEDRPLYNVVISDVENIKNIDQLQKRHLQLLDQNVSAQQKAAIVDSDPVFTSFSYNIHGNEAASTEAVMQLLYRLAAATDPEMDEALKQSVVQMYICINPDGRDRYVHWINSVGRDIPGVNERDLEHYAPWPNGRTNHYWFDLNRDWVWGVHIESRGHIEEYQKWMPQVHVDYHEQGYHANYFTTPGAQPRNLLLPDTYEAWSDTFGRANIEVFDQEGLSYFTRDAFDFFYPGYGSSYPSTMGAIGMLTEQGGIGAGRAVETEDGYVLTLRQRVFDHYMTSLASIKTAAKQRKQLLSYSLAAWNPANSKEQTAAYIIRAEEKGFVKDFLQVLDRHGIDIHKASANFKHTASDYWSDESATQSFQKGDYIILADQSRHLFVHSILARNMAIEDSVMYDMATWSAPLAYNLDAFASQETPKVKMELITKQDLDWQGAYISLNNEKHPPYAYVINWDERWAPKALSMLWEKGYRVRSAAEGFSDGKHSFAAGSLIVLRARNYEKEDRLEADMKAIATASQTRIYAMPSGRMKDGYDLGSTRNRPVDQPRVAMLVEPPFSTYTSGQVYFLFDQETGFGVDRIRTSAFQQTSLPKFGQRYGYADLNDYDVLILPGARGLERLFWKDQLYQIRQWLERGGTLIAMENAATRFTKNKDFGKVELKKQQADTSTHRRYLTYHEHEHYHGLRRIPGSALQATIDTSHPLAFGVKERLFNLKLGTNTLLPSANLESVGMYAKDTNSLLVAGYASKENLNYLAGTSFAGVQKFGEGKLVYLVDNPHYRMFWRGASRMMQNAVMLLPGF